MVLSMAVVRMVDAMPAAAMMGIHPLPCSTTRRIAALRPSWARRVTLFGQSAGGSSVASIAQDARNAGLLHRAIVQSGSLHGASGFPGAETAAAYAEAF